MRVNAAALGGVVVYAAIRLIDVAEFRRLWAFRRREFLLAIFATAGGWWLWTYVLSSAPAGITGLNALAVPVIAVIASWIQLGEQPPPHELLGMALIGAALALLGVLGFRKAEATPVD